EPFQKPMNSSKPTLPFGRARTALAALQAFLLIRVPAEGPADAELPELVPHHVLGHEHIQERASVVHLERVPDELGNDRAAARPRLDRLALAGLVELLHLAEELLIDVRTLLQTASHITVSLTAFGCVASCLRASCLRAFFLRHLPEPLGHAAADDQLRAVLLL